MWKRVLLFLILNLGALALGNWLMGDPSTNDWYQEQFKAPWTPPNWAFGAAWLVVMVCFSFFMARVTDQRASRGSWIFLFVLQFILNVSWSPLFFQLHLKAIGLTVLALLLLVLFMMAVLAGRRGHSSWTLLPYILWMLVALSLNGYILFNN